MLFLFTKKYFYELSQLLNISYKHLFTVIFLILCVGSLDLISLSQLQNILEMTRDNKSEVHNDNRTLMLILVLFLFVNMIRAIISFFSIRYIFAFSFFQQAHMFSTLIQAAIIRDYSNNNDLTHFNTLAKEHVRLVTEQTVMAWLKIISEGIILLIIFFFLMFHFPLITLIATCVMGFILVGYLLIVSNKFHKYSQISVFEAEKSIGLLKASYELSIEIKMANATHHFLDLVKKSQTNYANAGTNAQSIQQSSRYLVDIGLIIIIFFILYITEVNKIVDHDLTSIISIFAFAGIKALPALYQIIGSLSALKFSRKYVSDLVKALNEENKSQEKQEKIKKPLIKNTIIKFQQYNWGNEYLKPQKLNLELKPHTITVFSGQSGSGKSTFLKSLIKHSSYSGDIFVNSALQRQNYSLYNYIAYVGQHFTVFPGTILENIFMNQPIKISNDELIDMLISLNLIEKESDASLFLETKINENGSNFSGGELQRISVLRGLVQNKELLCLDEPTASISDKATQDLLNYIKNKWIIKENRRVIIATHDKNVYKYASKIISL